jgi:hypothetical protein
MVLSDVPSDVSSGGVLTLVVPLALLAIVLLWAWSLRRRAP